jgi:flagellar protein FlaF
MQPSKPGQPNNPYANAAGAYGSNAQKNTSDPRELEAQVLLKSARFLQDIQDNWDNVTSDVLEETLRYNRQIWMLFYDTALENPEGNRPNDLRSNIVNLANFVFKREIEIMSKPEKKKLDVLININREIAAGLASGVKASAEQDNPAGADAGTKKPPSGGTSTSA